MNRTKSLLQIRPEINIENRTTSKDFESFQNEVLRPVLKFQHDLLCFTFLNFPTIAKNNFNNKHNDQKRSIIIDSLKSNQKIKSNIIQSIISLMTIDELERFYSNKSEFQKRILSMATQRLIDGLI